MADDPDVLFVTDERTSAATRARITQAYRQGILKPGEVSINSIAHEDDCPALRDGACACIPDILITTSAGERWLDVGCGFERVPS